LSARPAELAARFASSPAFSASFRCRVAAAFFPRVVASSFFAASLRLRVAAAFLAAAERCSLVCAIGRFSGRSGVTHVCERAP
jgi:hypothetical protein